MGIQFSHTKGWIFGYKLHITSSTGSLIVPLSADFTQADVQDNQIYPAITSSLPQGVRYMAADSGYDDHKLYNLSTDRGFELVCPVSQIYNHTSSDRLQLIEFYESELGQEIYSWRGISVEPLIEHIKSVFKIDPLPVRSYQKVAGLVLLSVLLYQIIVYYNCMQIGVRNQRLQKQGTIYHCKSYVHIRYSGQTFAYIL